MKKLFISCPMRNRTEYAIKASMEQMHRIAEAVFGEELEVIPTYFEGDPPENSNQALWYLGESIKKMSEANYFIGHLRRGPELSWLYHRKPHGEKLRHSVLHCEHQLHCAGCYRTEAH